VSRHGAGRAIVTQVSVPRETMLNPFVSARVLRVNNVGAIAISIAAHGGLIAMAVSARAPSPPRHHFATAHGEVVEVVRFMRMTPAVPTIRRARSPSRSTADRTTHRAIRPLQVANIAPIVLPDIIPAVADIDLTGRVTDSLDFVGHSPAEVVGPLVSGRTTATQNGAYLADAVDRVVMPLASNPVPAYPRSMAAAGIEANFVVVFVVDSTGRIDRGSLEFPATAQPLFAESVRRALERSRYRPAEMDGRPVRQLVQQEFFFRMEK
jgi:TonB family protein